MQLLFSRHGNTFAPHEIPVWVGAKEDLPLVDSGIQQAKNLAYAIQRSGFTLKAIYCGPLRRTRDYAKIVLEEIHIPLKPLIDSRLQEIDYGIWSGLSSVEIQKKGYGLELAAWEELSQWPKEAGWQASPELMFAQVKSFSEDLIKKYAPEDNILIISSNGRLRYFLQLIPVAFAQHMQNKNFKVATGNLCLFDYDNKKWQLKFWDKKPEVLCK
jgi:broad specificity phosphatase PhoE